ncbi:MAG: glycerol-3-phosphate acyltransferase [Clostridia bacterium]|nr:glycerol-3-phosphate acyltransferase [Clostridia bacterium]
MPILYCFVIGYVIGIINPAFIIGKLKGFDIRTQGSGNAGGSNALITMGRWIGFACIIFDILKTFAAIKLAEYLFPDFTSCLAVTVSGCVLGHIYPVTMHFRGGKGLACIAGGVLAYSVPLFFIALTVEAVIAIIINYICVIPITASIVFPIWYLIATGDVVGFSFMAVAAIVILSRHRENLARIKNGTELHLSYLWNNQF